MARVGGRNRWIAVPVGLLCAGVVGALVWLATPMLPTTVQWAGETLRGATTYVLAQDSDGDPIAVGTASKFTTPAESGCRALYPDPLWAELTWTRGALLTQTVIPPPTAVEPLTEALAPAVLVTCGWRADGDLQLSTTVSRVAVDAPAIAQATLEGAGFRCTTGAVLTCTRASGDVIEEHLLRDDLWVSTVETSWHPLDYGAQITTRLWG